MELMPSGERVISIAATFTAEALQPGLAFWIAELGLPYETRFAGFNTVFQQLLDPAGLFAANTHGVNVALVRFEDWAEAGIDSQVQRFANVARTAPGALAAPLIVAICPPLQEHRNLFAAREAVLAESFADSPGIHLIRPADWDRLYPCGDPHDEHADRLGRLPFTPLFFTGLATAIMRKIHAIVAPPFKVVALDCDDTLWAGICGEDGPQGVTLDAPRKALQEFMAARRREGLLLALISKNNEEDVLETFRAHPEMPLGLDQFVSRRINWESKAENLKSVASELGLGLDSFILVDDSRKECKEVQAALPGVLALLLPEKPGEISEFLDHVWAFDRARVTEEDRKRAELYAQSAVRNRAMQSAVSLEEFINSLDVSVRIAPLESAHVPRVAQLTQRTNQMNASLIRRGEAEVRSLLDNGAECLTVTVADRFGDYGLTGAMIFRAAGDTLTVETFLLSCRALGRGVEHRMIARLGEIAVERGLKFIEVPFVAGQRNRPATLFLESLTQAGANGVFRFSADDAAAVKYRPGNQVSVTPAGAPAPSNGSKSVSGRANYGRIAAELRSPAVIFERTRLSMPGRRTKTPFAPPSTPLERELAELWASLLNVPEVGINDHFFDLGGHSLLAVQLLSRVRQIYGVDLSLEVVYSGEFTVAELAKAMELKQLQQAGAEYGDLLAELEGMSDEEARALLAKEQTAS